MNVNRLQVVHYPDIVLAQYCHDQFGLNKGVYNTIDEWLFSHGEQDVILRRTQMVRFLEDCKNRAGYSAAGQLTFGRGTLTEKLALFQQRYGHDSQKATEGSGSHASL
ncbi:hypothetical protein XYCOK13_23650 [Xylanibacillus composti]|uniref:Uncharacterized protein n=1 Tax=Xylanibacillus composti TaxID=1572762 RepID=A0A8J4H4V9_9BACL|nr:hypothetical protein XYCOK13_23650 [Xylanibacillus composti]